MLAKGTVDRDNAIAKSKCIVCNTLIGSDRYIVLVDAGTLEAIHRDCHDTYIKQSKGV